MEMQQLKNLISKGDLNDALSYTRLQLKRLTSQIENSNDEVEITNLNFELNFAYNILYLLKVLDILESESCSPNIMKAYLENKDFMTRSYIKGNSKI